MLKRPVLSLLLPFAALRKFFLKNKLEKINNLTNYVIDTVLYFDNYLITPNQARNLALRYMAENKNIRSTLRGCIR